MSKWVKLPEGAQVTLSSGEYEATQGMGLKDKVIIAAVIIGGLFLFGHCHNDSAATNTPRPHTTTSAPERVDHG
jgi:hypothetical protein